MIVISMFVLLRFKSWTMIFKEEDDRYLFTQLIDLSLPSLIVFIYLSYLKVLSN